MREQTEYAFEYDGSTVRDLIIWVGLFPAFLWVAFTDENDFRRNHPYGFKEKRPGMVYVKTGNPEYDSKLPWLAGEADAAAAANDEE
eukprot:CAMPEP_0118853142 /NCGR_PEP_ID=MMETSP1163-20130328/1843_1 /TAXON_ID=124430 /ORGANISM="Phaeomonas parva, Strain CCMP2877" /LENGTH=86 /DNA_ID=CAMNT_0006785641 /DNA_START=380 /DNA_END=640 /DNA_ORIENTATION=-